MTAKRPITSDQRRQLRNFVMERLNKGIKQVGLDLDGLQRLLSRGGEFLAYMAEGIRRFSSATPDYTLAQNILGKDFITPEEVMAARPGVVYTDEQVAVLDRTLPSRENLEWLREHDYALVPAPPNAQSLVEHRSLVPTDFQNDNTWFLDPSQSFSRTDKAGPGWLAIKKTIVSDSTAKTWGKQQSLLSGVEHVPNSAELHWFLTTYHAVRKVRLMPTVYARTSSVGQDGARVYVGGFGGGAPNVGGWDDKAYDYFGLAAARKF